MSDLHDSAEARRKERKRKYDREYYARNREKICNRMREYHARNRREELDLQLLKLTTSLAQIQTNQNR